MDVTAICFPEDGWWVIEVPEVRGVHTQAKRLDKVACMAADAVGLMAEVDPASVRVTVIADPRPYSDERLAQWSDWLKTLPGLAA